MSRVVLFAALAVSAYVGLVVIEMVQSNEPFSFLALAVDIFEMALLAGAVAMTAFISVEARAMRSERANLMRDLAQARQEGERWRVAARGHVEGLSRAIAAQFNAWGLTAAEADVAAYMLKGLAHKEIASLRGGSEATVRQHATTVYRKSGLASRTQLTAFFLEDLLPPSEAAATVTVLPGGRQSG